MSNLKHKFAEITARRIKRAAVIRQADADHESHEEYMAAQNVSAILEQAEFIADAVLKMHADKAPLQDWLEDKISKVADDVDEIYKYLRHGVEF